MKGLADDCTKMKNHAVFSNFPLTKSGLPNTKLKFTKASGNQLIRNVNTIRTQEIVPLTAVILFKRFLVSPVSLCRTWILPRCNRFCLLIS